MLRCLQIKLVFNIKISFNNHSDPNLINKKIKNKKSNKDSYLNGLPLSGNQQKLRKYPFFGNISKLMAQQFTYYF